MSETTNQYNIYIYVRPDYQPMHGWWPHCMAGRRPSHMPMEKMEKICKTTIWFRTLWVKKNITRSTAFSRDLALVSCMAWAKPRRACHASCRWVLFTIKNCGFDMFWPWKMMVKPCFTHDRWWFKQQRLGFSSQPQRALIQCHGMSFMGNLSAFNITGNGSLTCQINVLSVSKYCDSWICR